MERGKLKMTNPGIWNLLLSRRGDGGMRLNIEMSKAYDIAFGIFGHQIDEWTPLKSVAQHPAEDPWSYLGRKNLIHQYDTFGIKEYMTLNEFLEAPFPIAAAVLERATDKLKRLSEEQDTDDEKLRAAEQAMRRDR